MRTQEQEESRELHLARDMLNGPRRHGDFLTYLMQAFVWADAQNFELLKPLIKEIAEKYDLRCTCEPGSPDALPSGSNDYQPRKNGTDAGKDSQGRV